MPINLADVTDAVTRERDVREAVKTLLDQIAAHVAEVGGEAVDALVRELEAAAQTLADAVVANTVAAEAPAPEPEPVEAGPTQPSEPST